MEERREGRSHRLIMGMCQNTTPLFASIHYAPYGAGRSMLRPYEPRRSGAKGAPFLGSPLLLNRCFSVFCRGVACYARNSRRMPRLPDYPFSTEWWGSVGAQHATPCAVRRIMIRCESGVILTHTLSPAGRGMFPTLLCSAAARYLSIKEGELYFDTPSYKRLGYRRKGGRKGRC